MSVFLKDLDNLPTSLLNEFVRGNFTVNKTVRVFSGMGIDFRRNRLALIGAFGEFANPFQFSGSELINIVSKEYYQQRLLNL